MSEITNSENEWSDVNSQELIKEWYKQGKPLKETNKDINYDDLY